MTRRAATTRRALLALSCLLAGACAGAGAGRPPTLDEIRARAAESPEDGDAQRSLALAEMLSGEGDPARVDAAMERALATDTGVARLHLMAGVNYDVHGHPAAALDAYAQGLELATGGAREPGDAFVAELTANALAGLADAVTGQRERSRAALEAALARPGLAASTRHAIGSQLIDLAYRRGDLANAKATAKGLGCLTEWRIAGPFGPRDLLGFDRDLGVAVDRPLAASYDLGPSRGVRATRDLGAKGCSVQLGGGPVAAGGTSFVQAELSVAQAGRYVLRLDTPNSAEVFIGGQSLLRIDRRAELTARVVYLPIQLPAGKHLVTVKLATHHPSPVMSLAVSPTVDDDALAVGLPPLGGRPHAGYALYMRAAIAMLRGDVLAARETLRGLDAAERISPHLSMHRASLALADPLVPGDVRDDDARRLLGAALKRDPSLWNPTVQLATMAAENGRVKEAIEALRLARQRWPEVPAIGLTLANLLDQKGWHAESDRVVDALREQVPDACGPINAQIEALRRRDREREAAELVEALMDCHAQANARFSLLLRQRRWDDAGRELDRLQALDPPQNAFAWILARAELAKHRGDEAALLAQLARLRELYPAAETGALELIDRQLAAGDAAAARATLDAALAAEPAEMAGLYRLAPVVGEEWVMAPYRKDGAEAIRRYEAKHPDYKEPQVLVFDYMAARIFPDGSSVELVHTIQRAQSDEAVDELAEVNVPEGARLLTLRTIKPDGRRLEADDLGGNKETISLPSMASGDYVETEYVIHKGPSEGFPGGYLGERFYFKSFEVPFDFSQMVIVLPESMAYEVDPRGPAPEIDDRVDSGLRTLTWTVQNSTPLSLEPGSVSAREYIPSVRIGVRAEWPTFVESIRDVLVDRDLRDPAVARLVAKIVGDAAPGDHEARARRLYDWVLDNVENNNDMFSQAAVMLRARSGNRARVLHYLLGLAGVPSSLGLVRNAAMDATESTMADGETYDQLMVAMGEGEHRTWLFTVERWAPFGYVPPALRGQPALLLAEGAPALVVPAGTPEDEGRSMELDVTLREDGGAHVEVAEKVEGGGAIAWRNQLESVPEAELERRFEEEYVARLVPGASLTAVSIEGREREADAVTLRYGFDVDVLGRKVNDGWALPALLSAHLATNYARLAKRTTTLMVLEPLYTHVRFRYHLPEGVRAPSLPEPVRIHAGVPEKPTFHFEGRFENDTLVVERRIQLPAMRIAPEHYAAFASFCRRVDEVEAKELVLRGL